MVYEGEKFFGISQQTFSPQRQQLLFAALGANMGGNDHLAFIKTEGKWRENDFDTGVHDLHEEDDDIAFTSWDFKGLYVRLQALFVWLEVSSFKDVFKLAFNPEQLPYIQQLQYNEESAELVREKLRNDMTNFAAGIKDEDYHNFEKSSFMCIHLNLDGIAQHTEKDGETGWWIPLKHSIVAWRAINMQKPKEKIMATAGTLSMTKNQDELEIVFKGNQMFTGDFVGIDMDNFNLFVGPPNNTNLADTRPTAPAKPTSFSARLFRATINNVLVTDQRLPWASREKLCPNYDADFDELQTYCDIKQSEATKAEFLKCASAYAKFYPCFSYYVRTSKKYSHGIDGLVEFTTIFHIMKEMPWKTLKALAADKPWDDEFNKAMVMFGHA